jgi:hypothetical protein
LKNLPHHPTFWQLQSTFFEIASSPTPLLLCYIVSISTSAWYLGTGGSLDGCRFGRWQLTRRWTLCHSVSP